MKDNVIFGMLLLFLFVGVTAFLTGFGVRWAIDVMMWIWGY